MSPQSKLDAYEAKRDFQKTAEPRGNSGVKPSDALRFVVQKHDATRLHFDLRLELDGVFKSWAVTKGPSLNPADKRLAVEVEDHPLGYGDFEGTIPKGQYGGGTVQLFDRGTWEPEGDRDPAESLAAGELKFILHGKRLNGSFVLVRMKSDKFGGKRTNWLLIKHRDDDANDGEDGGGILAIDSSVASGRPMDQIAAGKGRAPKPFMLGADKAPAADAIWNSNHGLAKAQRVENGTDKVAPAKPTRAAKAAAAPAKAKAAAKPARKAASKAQADPMPDFVEPQLCKTVDTPPATAKWIHEIKFDGYRMQLRVEGGTAILRTRSGLDWTDKFPTIAGAAKDLPDAILDGEVVALDEVGAPNFAALQAAIAAGKTQPLIFFAFDLLHANGVDLRKEPLHERKAELQHMLEGRGGSAKTIRYVEHFDTDGPAVLASAREMALEGIVSKRTDAAYRSGRSDSWTKAKCRVGHEVVLGGWTETKGKFSSLLGGTYQDGKLIPVGRIGTGFSAATVAKLMPKLKAHASAKTPFAVKGSPIYGRGVHWLEPVLVAEIEFAGWTGDGSVRQGAFKGLREDKPAKDVVAEKPVAAGKADVAAPEPAASKPSALSKTAASSKKASGDEKPSDKPAAAKPRKSGKATVMGVPLSHPDKALWPDGGDAEPVTKLDLAAYFEAVGAWMMPHIEGRPCSIIRAPDGISGQTFFQRHAMAGGSKLFDTVKILGDHEPYLVINHVEGLAAVAQSGGLELHPSNCAPGDPLVPGRLVFDLDPAPDVAFSEVVRTAKALKERIEALGLASFCKTTGGKGLHVVTPLAPSRKAVSWDEAKQFARDVCVAMERDEPKRYLTKMSKAARTGRIFLDYLRNDRIATAVAPLSPRGRPHAPVSMPVTWAQVKSDLDPARYTVRSVPALLKRSKAWAEYAEAASPLADAIAKLR